MYKPTVYLGGPILGLDENEAKTWRFNFDNKLSRHNMKGISPLRCEPLPEGRETYGNGYDDPKFGVGEAIAAKNRFDVERCDMILCYFPEMPRGLHASYGTLCELSWSKPYKTILVSRDPEIVSHPVVRSNAGWKLANLDDALEVIVGILGAYATGGKNV